MDSGLRQKIEDFLYHEAELLDERRLREWLELFTDDARYSMPIRYNPLERPEALNQELSKSNEAYYFNDTKETLRISASESSGSIRSRPGPRCPRRARAA
jgi:3-phenylpropionate/cinnamic acid dioxygenase small subunit